MLLRCEHRERWGRMASDQKRARTPTQPAQGPPRSDEALDRNGGGKGIEIESAPGCVLRIRDVVDARPQLEIFDGDVAGVEI